MKSSPPAVEPTCGSSFPLLAIGVLAIVAGGFHGNAPAVALGVPLVAVPLVLHAYVRFAASRVSVERMLPRAVFEGESVEVTVRLHNRSRLPLFYPIVLDVFTPELHQQKRLVFPYRVVSGESVQERYTGKCLLPRGIYTLGAGVVTVSDPFGWVQRTVPIGSEHRLTVYPNVQDFGLPERLGAIIAALRDDTTCARRGESLEFLSVREYRPGDPLRRVHWPLTAHRGMPIVREFSQTSVGDLAIFLDLHTSALIGIGRGSSLEHAVKIAVALAARALRSGVRVQLAAAGRVERSVPLGAGPAHLTRVLEFAARARPDGDTPLDALLARTDVTLRRGDCAVVFISPYVYESRELVARLRSLRRRGMRVVACLFDDVSFRSLWHGEQPAPGGRFAFTNALRRVGVETIDVACGADLARVFEGTL